MRTGGRRPGPRVSAGGRPRRRIRLHFEHRGDHLLKGLDGRWSVFEAFADAAPAKVPAEHGDTASPREAAGSVERSDVRPMAGRVAFERRPRGRHVPPRRDETIDRAGLSARQREVLTLVAAGLSNAQIGSALYISRRTAEHHVSAILAKLGVTTRAEAAAAAVRLGVTPQPESTNETRQ